MGMLSFLRELVDGGGTADDKRVHAELEQIRARAEAAEREGDAAGEPACGPKLRRRYHFTGTVQGVGFRFTITNLADAVGATGWVENERDGSVTAEIQGNAEQVAAVVEGLDRYFNKRGRSIGGFVIDREYDVPLVADEIGFEPRYGY